MNVENRTVNAVVLVEVKRCQNVHQKTCQLTMHASRECTIAIRVVIMYSNPEIGTVCLQSVSCHFESWTAQLEHGGLKFQKCCSGGIILIMYRLILPHPFNVTQYRTRQRQRGMDERHYNGQCAYSSQLHFLSFHSVG